MSAIPPFTILQRDARLWEVVDARMNLVALAAGEEQAEAAANRLLLKFKESKRGAPKPEQEPEPREETIDEIVELFRRHVRLADETGTTQKKVFLAPLLEQTAVRIEKAVLAERTRVRKELDKLVRVAHRCHECAKFRTERCRMKDGEPDAFRIACEFFEAVWHRMTAEEVSLCEVQAFEINRLRQRVFQLESEGRR